MHDGRITIHIFSLLSFLLIVGYSPSLSLRKDVKAKGQLMIVSGDKNGIGREKVEKYLSR